MKVWTKDNFDQEVMEASKPVLVKFFSPTCHPCRMMTPVIEELAEKYKEKMTVGEVDINTDMDIARRFYVTAVPTIILFKDGNAVAQTVGYNDIEDLEDEFLQHIN